jgi:hypothetical protein
MEMRGAVYQRSSDGGRFHSDDVTFPMPIVSATAQLGKDVPEAMPPPPALSEPVPTRDGANAMPNYIVSVSSTTNPSKPNTSNNENTQIP